MDRFHMRVKEIVDVLELTKISPQQIEELLHIAMQYW